MDMHESGAGFGVPVLALRSRAKPLRVRRRQWIGKARNPQQILPRLPDTQFVYSVNTSYRTFRFNR